MSKRTVRRGYTRRFDNYEQSMAIPQDFSPYGDFLKNTTANSQTTMPPIPEGLLRREYAWRKADIMSERAALAVISGIAGIIYELHMLRKMRATNAG